MRTHIFRSTNITKLCIAELNPDKSEPYNSEIDVNTNMDLNFDYFNLHELHKMSSKIDHPSSFSVMHTNTSSLTCNGEILEQLISNFDFNFDIIAVSETWDCPNINPNFQPIFLQGYHKYEGQAGSSKKRWLWYFH